MAPCSSYFMSQRMKDQRRELSYRREVMKSGCIRRGSVLANLKDFPVNQSTGAGRLFPVIHLNLNGFDYCTINQMSTDLNDGEGGAVPLEPPPQM